MTGRHAPLAICLSGATGRMGRLLAEAIGDSPDMAVCGALVRTGHPAAGQDLGRYFGRPPLGVDCCGEAGRAVEGADGIIDFSKPEALPAVVAAARVRGCFLLVGTTGLTASHHILLEQAAAEIPVLEAANTSLGVTLLAALVEEAAARLPKNFDIEILEAHHRAKRDAPSGTALHLAAAAARGRPGAKPLPPDRAGERAEGDIGYAVIRGGSITGEHSVFFAGPDERLELTHRAGDRRLFATGALTAARWLAARPAGRYSMRDVLGL